MRGILIFILGVLVGGAAGGGWGYKVVQDAYDDLARVTSARDAARSEADTVKKQQTVLEAAKSAAESAKSAAEASLAEAQRKIADAQKAADSAVAAIRTQLDAANKAKSDLENQLAVTRSAPQPAPAPAQ